MRKGATRTLATDEPWRDNESKNMPKTLKELVGDYIEVRAGDDCEDGNGVYFSLFGKLEAPEDGMNRFYLRCGETVHGNIGISFHPEQVEDIVRGVYIYRVELKATLNASWH